MATPNWYAAYICARHEKRVTEQLRQRRVECFLPLYSTIRRWKNGRHQVELPLFPGYVFVHLDLRDRLRVLEVPSVVRLIGFGGLPTALPTEEIEILRRGMEVGKASPHPYLTIGRRVRISSGPFSGLHGILRRRKSEFRVVVSVELIHRAMALEVDESELAPVCEPAFFRWSKTLNQLADSDLEPR